MPPPSSGSQGDADNSMNPIWITLGLLVLFGFIWYFFKTEIIGAVFTLKYYEASLLTKILPEKWCEPLYETINFIQDAKQQGYTYVSVQDVYSVSSQVGNYIRYPVIALLLIFALMLYRSNPLIHFKKTYSMFSLRKQEKPNWPQIVPISQLDLINQDIDVGPWAMSIQPMEFAKRHGLLVIEKTLRQQSDLASKAILTASINRDEARKVFATQLGRHWSRIEDTPIYYQALYSVFASRIAGERDEANQLLKQISVSSESGQLNFSGTQKLLDKFKNHKIVTKINERHAFVNTVIISMLEAARDDGVVASADFLWLKPIDRRLWYTLNSVGRQTPYAEVAGIFAHWIVEKELGRKLNLPMVEEAVIALDSAVKEQIYIPDDEDE